MIKKRIIIIGSLFLLALSLLTARLVQIQLLQTEKFGKHNINLLEESVAIRTRSIELDDGRGVFLDRFGNSLTEESHYYVMLFPFLQSVSWKSNEVAKILGVKESKLLNEIKSEEEPFAFPKKKPMVLTPLQVKQLEEKNINGVIVAEKKVARKDTLAEHVIGLVKENDKEKYETREGEYKIPRNTKIGISGLQKSFDELLISETNAKLLYHVDGKGKPLFGEDVKYYDNGNPFYPVTVKTTLNYRLQEMMEKALNQNKISKGAAVLLDVETNEVLGMVSRPSVDAKDPFGTDTIRNLALQSNTPGSVFKTVVAAAALDFIPNATNQNFNCNLNVYGEEEVQAVKKKGTLTLQESFEQSCNYTFGSLSNQLLSNDQHSLDEAMNRLGIESTVGWSGSFFNFGKFHQFEEEESNTIWGGNGPEKYVGDKTLRQIGIGQLNVKLTPLAVANMMSTIARGGQPFEVKVVDEVLYKDGTSLYKFPSKKMDGKPYSKQTIEYLKEMMLQVVNGAHGTGFLVKGLPYQVAGKSGTAELNDDDDVSHNKWFAGFFPYELPKYALVVIQQNTTADNGNYALAYGDIVRALYKHDREMEQN